MASKLASRAPLVVRSLAKTGGRCETRSASDSRWFGIHQSPRSRQAFTGGGTCIAAPLAS